MCVAKTYFEKLEETGVLKTMGKKIFKKKTAKEKLKSEMERFKKRMRKKRAGSKIL